MNMTMKKIGMTLATLSLAFGLAACGKSDMKEVKLGACTKDGQTATLIVDFSGTAEDAHSKKIDLAKLARNAFDNTAHEMTGAEMATGVDQSDNKGLQQFMKNVGNLLDENNARVSQDFHLGVGSSRIPVIAPGCKL